MLYKRELSSIESLFFMNMGRFSPVLTCSLMGLIAMRTHEALFQIVLECIIRFEGREKVAINQILRKMNG